MRRAARIASVALITAGLVMLTDVGATLLWQEPVSAVYGSIQQSKAAGQLEAVENRFQALPERDRANHDPHPERDSPREAKRLAGLFAKTMREGEPIGRIEISSIGADYVVIEGTGTADLQKGPGHYPETGLPGQGKTIGIAGHRTTYQAPFNRIDDIDDGDRIELVMPYGKFTYRVTKHRIVEPTETEIVRDVGHERLVLTACHPLYSAAQRYAIFADLESFELAAS